MKFTVIGATGQTGSAVARTLKENGHHVRAIVRGEQQAQAMQALGYEPFIAQVTDTDALTQAFTQIDGAYLMNPPSYHSADMFATAHEVHAALLKAVAAAKVPHCVALSSVGAQHDFGTGNILTTYDFEMQIASSGLNISVLRAANFLDNWGSVIGVAKEKGTLPSMFLPLDKKWPMVFSQDIGYAAAQLLMQGVNAPRLIELHGAQDYSANDAAQALSQLLNQPIQAVGVPTEGIAEYFKSLGFPLVTAQAFQDMMQGFNTDHIVFTGQGQTLRGETTIEKAFAQMLHV